uniref:Uncharacterized protein n=1 Tax=Oryza sativa subsp. japonica TaxID=39947 RepID=Q7Y155_ORYSJ|nr:hypothetical protein [Oryza sativa Japonica Group]
MGRRERKGTREVALAAAAGGRGDGVDADCGGGATEVEQRDLAASPSPANAGDLRPEARTRASEHADYHHNRLLLLWIAAATSSPAIPLERRLLAAPKAAATLRMEDMGRRPWPHRPPALEKRKAEHRLGPAVLR